MDNLPFYLSMAGAGLIAVAIVAFASLKGFRGWIDLKKAELEAVRRTSEAAPSAASRIEVADLKERLRKLEAIAAGVDC
jgi:hypothetical protein